MFTETGLSVRTQPPLKPEKEVRQCWKNTLSFKGRVPFPSRKLAEHSEGVNRVSVNFGESSRKERLCQKGHMLHASLYLQLMNPDSHRPMEYESCLLVLFYFF